MPFDFFDHTGDIGVRVTADSLARLFEVAAAAFVETIADLRTIEPRVTEVVRLPATELELLLVDWLSELLYRFEARGMLFSFAAVALTRESGNSWALSAEVQGEPFDAARHAVKALIKAVTYHKLAVRQLGAEWEATIVFDV